MEDPFSKPPCGPTFVLDDDPANHNPTLMSSTSVRYNAITLSFLPSKRDHRLAKNVRSLRVRTSRRRARRAVRELLSQMKELYARTP